MSDRVIGLDIGASAVKAAQVRRNSDGTFVVEKQAARPTPRGAIADGRIVEEERTHVSAIIKQMFDEEDFDTRDVIFGLNSSSSVFMQEMVVPAMLPEDVEKAMPEIIAATNSNIDPEDSEFSYTIVNEFEEEGRPKLRVLVYSCRADYAREVGEVVEAAGLNVVGADLNALAVLRAVALFPRPERSLDAIVDIGANVTLLLLHHNGVPKMLSLDPDSAGDRATEQVLIEMNLDDTDVHKAEWEKINNEDEVGPVSQARAAYAENLSKKIAGGLNSYLERSYEFDALANVTLVGGGAHLHGLGHQLRNALPAAVPLTYAVLAETITDVDGGEVERHEVNSGGDYLVAVGLGTAARI